MHVLYLTATYFPAANGVAISVKSTKEVLEKLGHKVTVVAPEFPDYNETDPHVLRYASIPNPLNSDYPLPTVPFNRKILDQLLNKEFDIVHAHHPFHISWFANTYAQASSAPFIFTYHTLYKDYADVYLKFLPEKYRDEIVLWGTDYAIKKADFVVTPSRAIKKMLNENFPYVETHVLPTGVSINKDTKADKDLKRRFNIKNDSILLLSLSRLSKEKNIELAIRSLAKLPSNFCLLIVGEGPHRQNLSKLVNKLSLESRVRFVGSIPHEKVPSIMKSCDIFLFPSITETQGLNLLEALYCGLPVVATSSEVSLEWVPDFAGNVVSNDVLSFSNAILEISKKFNFSDSENISKWADQFSIGSTSKAMANAYEDIVSRKKLSHQLYATGWQSWSTKPNSIIKIPTRNYSPGKDNYICASTKKRLADSHKIYGWCSWYAYHNDINSTKIFKQADFIKEHSRHLPLEYLILDDGWTKWGDWLQTDTSKFPGGLSPISEYLKERGLKLGIWLAPFLAEKDSQVFTDHPDWFVTYNGVLTEGFKAIPVIDSYWNFRRYILDITNLDVQDYLHSCIDSLVKTYGIDMLKLDFLYAPYFDKSLTSKEAGKLVYGFLHEVKSRNPHVHINGCGVPLSCGVGVVDSMRISVDTIVPYLDGVPIINSIVHNSKIRTILESIKTRKFTEEYWLPDPDVFVCRKSLGIKDSLLLELHSSIKSLNGNILLGDDLTKLSNQELETYIYTLFTKVPK